MDSDIVSNLALLFITAGLTTIIFKALKQPLILGYIVAGFLVGPHFGLFPTMSSTATVEQWSEIGIIFMLFGLGLEFSFRKIVKIGVTALLVSGTILIGMTLVGMFLGNMLGWTTIQSLFLGAGILSMSSTIIILKAFDDSGVGKKQFKEIVIGALIFEDIIAVVLMVLLSTMAASKQFEGGAMVWAVAKLMFFLVLWFVIGLFIIPTILRKGRKWMNDEMLIVLSIGLCFGMVVLAQAVGFSSALGAFVMGSILAETVEAERIEKSIKGIKDLFGAVFFVSVGMMVDPASILHHWALILLLSLVVVFIRPLFAAVGVILSGKGLDNAVKVSFSLVPVSEFAFIIVSQGISQKVLPDYIYPVVVAVSVITTFITPYFVKWSVPASAFLHEKLPSKLVGILSPVQEKREEGQQSEWKELLKGYFTRYAIYMVLMIAFFTATTTYLPKLLHTHFTALSEGWIHTICAAVTVVLMFPCQASLSTLSAECRKHYASLWNAGKINRGPLIALVLLGLSSSLLSIVVELSYFFTSKAVLVPMALCMVVAFFLLRRRLNAFTAVETRFLNNLSEKEEYERKLSNK